MTPVLLSSLSWPESIYSFAINAAQTYLFAAMGLGKMTVVDISNLAAPATYASVSVNPIYQFLSFVQLSPDEKYLFCSFKSYGLIALDLTDMA